MLLSLYIPAKLSTLAVRFGSGRKVRGKMGSGKIDIKAIVYVKVYICIYTYVYVYLYMNVLNMYIKIYTYKCSKY